MNLLLEVTNPSSNWSSWVLLGVLALFLIISPFLMKAKNKKEMDKAQQMIDSIKKGDMVMTAAGVVGKVISIENKLDMKLVTIETGDEKHKGYMAMDINAIYANLSNPVIEAVSTKNEDKKDEKVEEPIQDEKIEENVNDKAATEPVVESQVTETESEKVAEKKPAKKVTTSKKKSKK